ncbi:hypothetical protein TrLO_g15 [Triparma laevis f. longispina]|uniref:Alpha-1,3-glucosyltransferase n=1 Tax=Triparma laevis f. longispina TaxID=1714387 RepID=A0A9W7APY2_9STRA|nr:hypothetical protein TrLO_g15 [Triparma laevis f. longispina]
MLLITLFSFYPLIKLYQQKIKPIPCAVIIMFNVFMLAYHVHEKAIMNVIILMFCNVNFKEKGLRDAITFNGYASFLPLWLGGENRLFRVGGLFVYQFFFRREKKSTKYNIFERFIVFYVLLAEGLEVLGVAGENTRLEFLPTLIFSVGGAVVNLGCWRDLYLVCCEDEEKVAKSKQKKQ